MRAGRATVTVDAIPMPRPGRRAPVPPMKSRVPPGLTLPAAARATLEDQQQVLVEGAARLREVHLEHASVLRPARCDHYVVDGGRQLPEEPLERSRIRGVEGLGAERRRAHWRRVAAARDSGR